MNLPLKWQTSTLQKIRVLLLGLLTLSGAHASDIEWDQGFDFVAPPSELHPGWKHLGEETASDEPGILKLDSTTAGANYWVFSDRESWNAQEPTTVEVCMRAAEVDSGSEVAAEIVLKDEDLLYVFKPKNREFRTYRIVLELGQARVYDASSGEEIQLIEGARMEKEIYSDAELQINSIGFGDYSRGAGGTSEWKFIRWTNQGAYEPKE